MEQNVFPSPLTDDVIINVLAPPHFAFVQITGSEDRIA
jgi:hypothetical protein